MRGPSKSTKRWLRLGFLLSLIAICPLASTYSSFSATTSTQAAFSAAKLFPPDNAAPPAVSGTLQVNQTLTASPGTWSRNPSSYSYRWKRCGPSSHTCVAIGGATASSYVPGGADVGHALVVSVAAVNGGGSSSIATSGPTAVVPPYAQSSPAPTGLPAVGQTLTASTSGWLGQGLSFAYQWVRCDETGSACSDIPGTVSSSYTLVAADRRSAITVRVTATAAGATSTATSADTDPIAESANPIVAENQQPGTSNWYVPPRYEDARADGYSSESSVAPGGVLHLHVSTTPATSYRLEIYRLGWYGGKGGRLRSCIPSCSGAESGTTQTTALPDATTGWLDAGWPVTDQIAIGSDWTSGYYEVKIVLTTAASAGKVGVVPFIVTAPAGSAPSAVVVQVGTNTWQAYNHWGGKSLYNFNSTNGQAAVKVSFNRPDSGGTQAGPYPWDLKLVHFLERYGHDVSYVTDYDVDQNPSSLASHRVAISVAHDEYWTKGIRDGWEAARNAGTNLIFAGADIGVWQARFENAGRTLVEYRSASLDPNSDPTQKTVRFQELATPRPPCELEGVQYGNAFQAGNPPIPLMLTQQGATDALVAGTGLSVGNPMYGLVTYEYDAIVPGCAVPSVHALLSDGGTPHEADTTYYRAPSGALVVAFGSVTLALGLDELEPSGVRQPGLEALVGNVLDTGLGLQIP